ncbi:hypothetical protein E2C01_050462 [Portunus trituberculatus]|uniref:Uncharacterized protein n=1 Tax=Portunus trituberculatus TaxID=210409 RepID=A0A5B7G922_PORTR|nr:hypothetical protein [Portunus trituberculatus]
MGAGTWHINCGAQALPPAEHTVQGTMDKLDDAVEVMPLVKTAVQPGPNPVSAGSTSPGDHMDTSNIVIKRN